VSQEVIISTRAAEYRYKQGFALQPITLDLARSEICFIMGANGSGKSTLGRLLAGIYKPCSGSVTIDGEDSRKLSLSACGRKIGYLWQKPDLQLFAPTVWEDMTFLGEFVGGETPKVRQNAEYWLDQMGLLELKVQSVHLLSRGEKQRLALAGVLAAGSRYLILDEPTTGLDEARRGVLADILRLLHSDGIGISVISHDRELAEQLATRRLIIDKGGISDDIRPPR